MPFRGNQLAKSHFNSYNFNTPTDHSSPWSYSFETTNGIRTEVEGSPRTVDGADTPVSVMRGSYSYPGPDGRTYTVDWIADETGN